MDKYFEGHKIFISNGYPAIWKDGKQKRIHILQMEKKFGRKLSEKERVHHKDENKLNYDIDNLICFASNKDHSAFHKGYPYYLDDEGIAHCDVSVFRIEGKVGKYTRCPICGNNMSVSSTKCKACRLNIESKIITKKSKDGIYEKPTKEELQKDLEFYKTYTAIGEKYGVTGNAVKKWAKKYNIYHFCFSAKPDKDELICLLKENNITSVARYYKVSKDIVRNWIKYYKIVIPKKEIQCIETQKKYYSFKEAGKDIYPYVAYSTIKKGIKKSIQTGCKYKGYTWKQNIIT